jgi:mRNA-degrading endonuclease YafQ of YafQ-DinJ toxin-antitoxin module
MSLRLVVTTQFKKDVKRIKKRGCDLRELHSVLDTLLASLLPRLGKAILSDSYSMKAGRYHFP